MRSERMPEKPDIRAAKAMRALPPTVRDELTRNAGSKVFDGRGIHWPRVPAPAAIQWPSSPITSVSYSIGDGDGGSGI